MIETRVKLSHLLRKIKEVFRIFDYNKIAQNANRIGKNHSSKKIIIEALKTLTFDKKSVFRKIIFIFLETIIAILIANSLVIIPELSEPPVRTLGATIPENESHIFR